MEVLLPRGLHKPLGSPEAFLFLVQAFQAPLFQRAICQMCLVSGLWTKPLHVPLW